MKYKIILMIGILMIVLLSGIHFSEARICCEKLLSDGQWCQNADSSSQCNLSLGLRYWNILTPNAGCEDIERVPDCSGTCVDTTTGECTENVPRKKCQETPESRWYPENAGEPEECQKICCIMEVNLNGVNRVISDWLTNKECDEKAERQNIPKDLVDELVKREEMPNGDACEERNQEILNDEMGACLIRTDNDDTCMFTTRAKCNAGDWGTLRDAMSHPERTGNIYTDFTREGVLCTAIINGVKISSCAPTNNTFCDKDNKIYYKDNCSNQANIYNQDLYFIRGNRTREEYWSYKIDSDNSSICSVGPGGSSSCGNCDTGANTMCSNVEDSSFTGGVSRITNPDQLVCRSMSCGYDFDGNGTIVANEIKENGESWCVGIEGAVDSGIIVIHRNATSKAYDLSDRTALSNSSKYNLPGSRYYKLTCQNGKISPEECKDYRNAVCVQETNPDTNRMDAFCVINPWGTCRLIISKSQCENSQLLCKWIPGYSADWKIKNESERKEYQGSCVPLIAPGFDFWEGEKSQANLICSGASLQDSSLFEIAWYKERSDLIVSGVATPEDFSLPWYRKRLDTVNSGIDPSKVSHACLDGCYTIPYYGYQFNQIVYNNGSVEKKLYPEELPTIELHGFSFPAPGGTMYQRLTAFYDESEYRLPDNVNNYFLSTRRGHYCHVDNHENEWLTGTVSGRNYDCTPGGGSEDKDERKERDYPIYLTNDEWLRSITDKAHSLGDCGYKKNINGQYNDPSSEIITAVFQELRQDMETNKTATVEQIIWRGGGYLTSDEAEAYKTTLRVTDAEEEVEIEYTCNPENQESCLPTHYDQNPCKPESGGTIVDKTCPENNVCCAYSETPEQ